MAEGAKDRDIEVLQAFWDIMKKSARRWVDDHAPRLGAALAFYTILSLAPTLFIVMTVAGVVYSRQAAQQGIVQQLSGVVSSQVASEIGSILDGVSQAVQGGFSLGTIIGVLTLLLGATAFFTNLEGALNKIWDVEDKEDGGPVNMIRTRLTALLLVVALAVFVVFLIFADSLLLNVGEALASSLPGFLTGQSLRIVRLFITYVVLRFGFVMLTVAAVYKLLPDVSISWNDVWAGAAITAFLLLVGQIAIGELLNMSDLASTYGTAGSFVVLLLWVYYSALVFFFGAEITYVFAGRYGEKVRYQADHLPFLDRDEQAEQSAGGASADQASADGD